MNLANGIRIHASKTVQIFASLQIPTGYTLDAKSTLIWAVYDDWVSEVTASFNPSDNRWMPHPDV